jgi:hypothetical protein
MSGAQLKVGNTTLRRVFFKPYTQKVCDFLGNFEILGTSWPKLLRKGRADRDIPHGR